MKTFLLCTTLTILLIGCTAVSPDKVNYNIGVLNPKQVTTSDLGTKPPKLPSTNCRKYYPYAAMAANSYFDAVDLPFKLSDWQRVEDYRGNQDDSAESEFYASLYKHTTKSEIALVFRGTDHPNEWFGVNFAVAWWNNSKAPAQYALARALAAKIQSEYPTYKMTLVGHSLGGGLAHHAAYFTPKTNVIVFNTSPRSWETASLKHLHHRGLAPEKPPEDIHIYESGEALTMFVKMVASLAPFWGSHDSEICKTRYTKGNYFRQHGMQALAKNMMVDAADADDTAKKDLQKTSISATFINRNIHP